MLWCGGGVDAGVGGVAEFVGEFLVVLAGVFGGGGGDFGGEEGEDDAIFVGGPGFGV